MKRLLTLILALTLCVPSHAALGSNPRYIEEAAIGGGYADTVDGGIDLEKDGDIRTTGQTILGASTITANNQKSLILFSDSAGTAAQAGAFNNRLRIFGGSGQSRSTTLEQIVSSGARLSSINNSAAKVELATGTGATPTVGLTVDVNQDVFTAGDIKSGDDFQGPTGAALDLVPQSSQIIRMYEDSGTVAASVDTAGLVQVVYGIRPTVTNSITTGDSSYRWANVYSVLGDFTGNVSGVDFTSSGDFKGGASNDVDIVPASTRAINLYEDGGAVAASIDTSGIIQSVFGIRPTVTASVDNGASSRRWNVIYGVSLDVTGNGTMGDASTDLFAFAGRMQVRAVTDAGPMTATNGTVREIVFNTSDSKFYGCSVTGTPATWVALN